MPLIEAIPDETNIMKHKLVTLARGTSKLPVVTANVSKITLTIGATAQVNPNTLNFLDSNSTAIEPSGYTATIADRRLLSNFVSKGAGAGSQKALTINPYVGTSVSEALRGSVFSLTAINSTTLFGTNNKLLTTLTVTGNDTGASVVIPVEINKTVVAQSATQGETGITLG